MAYTILQVLRSKLNTAIILLVLLIGIGVVGFKILTNANWIDALYMTVITITTVGFKEVSPLDQDAKLFTILLILASVIIVGFAIKVITEYIITRNDVEELKQKRMQKTIDAMADHIIICGFGRNGKQAAKKLLAHKKSFVVIEKEKECVKKHIGLKIPFIVGNANEDDVLMRAGLDRANTLISALPSDSDNLFVVLSARQVNKDLHIISRASRESSYSKLKLAGANNVILPDMIGGDHMASLVVVPDLVEFIDNLAIVGESSINIEEIDVEKLYETSKIKTISDLELRKKTGCNVIGYKSPEGDYIINPDANQLLVAGSMIIVLGRPEQINKLNNLYNI